MPSVDFKSRWFMAMIQVSRNHDPLFSFFGRSEPCIASGPCTRPVVGFLVFFMYIE